MNIRNIGIFAHVDAGKTTLSEQLLLKSGAIRTPGSVDKGTAHTDLLPVERRRGISVKSTCVPFHWKDHLINLIDTPGHSDFSAEIECALWAPDGAVLLLSAVEGVEPQTELLFQALKEQAVPILFFINKTDREGADPARVLTEIRELLSKDAAMPADEDALLDLVSARDDEVMERYLTDGSVPYALLLERFSVLASSGQVYPVLQGSALRGEGIEALLDAVIRFLPGPRPVSDQLSAVVFAASEDPKLGRGVYVRLFGGQLKNRDTVPYDHSALSETTAAKRDLPKISQIRLADGRDTGVLSAGEIGQVFGLGDIPVGRILGDPALLPRKVRPGSFSSPLLTVSVHPEREEDRDALKTALFTLTKEDPLLSVRENRNASEMQLQVMGRIQLEILKEELMTRFSLPVSFDRPTMIYRETIREEAVGAAVYTMPKPCWAIIYFRIRPGERGSGVRYHSEVSFRDIPERYQHQIEQALPTALSQGRLGWQVTDVDITLTAGNYHHVHTHPLDFIVATPWGIQDTLRNGGSVLLEPVVEISFLLPEDCVGRVMSDVAEMRGTVKEVTRRGMKNILTAEVPAASCMDYSETLSRLSGGRAGMAMRLIGYRECPPGVMVTAKRRSVDPLDTSKYILAARSALASDIYDL